MVFSRASMRGGRVASRRRRVDGVRKRYPSTTLPQRPVRARARLQNRFCNLMPKNLITRASPASCWRREVASGRKHSLPSNPWPNGCRKGRHSKNSRLETRGQLSSHDRSGPRPPLRLRRMTAYIPLTHTLALNAHPSRAVANAGPGRRAPRTQRQNTQAETRHEAHSRPRPLDPDARRRHGHDEL